MSEKPLEKFGCLLRQWRTDRGLSRAAAAEKVGLSQSGLGMWEAGEVRDPVPSTLKLMSRVYEQPYSTILRHLISEKYMEKDAEHLLAIDTPVGKVYPEPQRILDDILEECDQLQQGWYFLPKPQQHLDLSNNPYYRAIKELVENGVLLRIWIQDSQDRSKAKEQVAAQMAKDGLSARRIEEYLRYEMDDGLMRQLFGDGSDVLALNEVYFLRNKPATVTEEDVLGYWTLPGVELGTLLIEVERSQAFKQFSKRKRVVEG